MPRSSLSRIKSRIAQLERMRDKYEDVDDETMADEHIERSSWENAFPDEASELSMLEEQLTRRK